MPHSLRALPRRLAPVLGAALKVRYGAAALDALASFQVFAEAHRLEFAPAAHDQADPRDLAAALQDAKLPDGAPTRALVVGAHDGRTLAVVSHLTGRRLSGVVVDDWRGDEAEEALFLRNVARLDLSALSLRRGASTTILPSLLEEEARFDLILMQSTLRGWGALADLCFSAALLNLGGVLLAGEALVQTPSSKAVVDRFHQAFGWALELGTFGHWRRLVKIAEIPA